MIVEFIAPKEGGSRGQSTAVILYIFGATKDNAPELKELNVDAYNKHSHSGDQEKVHFITASKNMFIVDPMYKEIDREIVKVDGSKAELKEVMAEFEKSEARNSTTKKPLVHIIVSLKEGETLSMDDWQKMIPDYMERMGWGDCTWISCLHKDTDVEHAHIALCNISNEPPHKSIQPSHMHRKSAIVRSELEPIYGLKHTPTPFLDKKNDWNPELQKNTIKNAIRSAIDEVKSKGKMNMPQFMQAMNKKGVGVFAQLKKDETEIGGLSFSFRGRKVAASHLSAGYSTKDIMQDITYDRELHLQRVTELNAQELTRTALYEQNENAIDSKAQELSEAYYKDGEDLYIVTEATQKQISEMFGNNQPTVEAYQNNSSGSGIAAVRIQPLQNDAADVTQLEDYAGESASKFYARADKNKANKIKQENEKKKKKQQQELMKAIRALVAAFCRHEAYSYREDLQQHPQCDRGLEKYGIDTTASVSVITKTQLKALQDKTWTDIKKGIKGKCLLKDNNDGYAYLEKDLRLMFTALDKSYGASAKRCRAMDNDLDFTRNE